MSATQSPTSGAAARLRATRASSAGPQEARHSPAEVRHATPMLSIANAFDEEEVRAFDKRVRQALGVEAVEYATEPKFDGLAVSLVLALGVAFYIYVRYVRFEATAGHHVPADAELAPLTPNTIVDPARLAQECARIRERGYSLEQCESNVDVCCAAAAVRDSAGKVVAAISVSVPENRWVTRPAEQWAELVLESAGAYSRMLGYAARS